MALYRKHDKMQQFAFIDLLEVSSQKFNKLIWFDVKMGKLPDTPGKSTKNLIHKISHTFFVLLRYSREISNSGFGVKLNPILRIRP